MYNRNAGVALHILARIAEASILILLLFLHFSAYQVIVLKVVDGPEHLPDNYDSKLTDSNNANKDNLNFYITAEIQNDPVYGKSWEFSVGDGTTYGGFVNKPLEKGEEYVIFQRSVTQDKDVSKLTQFRVIELIRKTVYLRSRRKILQTKGNRYVHNFRAVVNKKPIKQYRFKR